MPFHPTLIRTFAVLCWFGIPSPGVTAVQGQAEAPAPWFERFEVAGDLRLRHESFFLPDSSATGRFRLRLRFGLTVPITSSLRAGIGFVTGEPGNVTSHNVTFSGETSPKSFLLDQAWVSWTPVWRFTLTGGKLAAPPFVRPSGLLRSEMIFDDEVSPDGFTQELVLARSSARLVRRLSLVTTQWALRDFADSTDVWLLGGQASGQFGFGARTLVTLTGGYLDFRHGDRLAQARNVNRQLLVTNAVVLVDGTILEGGRSISPTPGNPFSRFASRFRLVTGSAGVTIDRAVGGRPVSAYIDLVHNAGAEEHATGFWAGATLGTLRRAGDWAITAVRARVEREAVLSMFSYSDLGLGGTNASGTILQAAYRPSSDVTLSLKNHIVALILPVDGLTLRALHRLQIDASVAF